MWSAILQYLQTSASSHRSRPPADNARRVSAQTGLGPPYPASCQSYIRRVLPQQGSEKQSPEITNVFSASTPSSALPESTASAEPQGLLSSFPRASCTTDQEL